MSLRPRFAGDGLLRLPMNVVPWRDRGPDPDGLMFTGHLGDTLADPFLRGPDGLLLAEALARLDTRSAAGITAWMAGHGVLDSGHAVPDLSRPRVPVRPYPYFEDPLSVVVEERDNVAWHVASLARLSDHLVPDEDGRTGPWDERWAQPAIRVGRDVLWLGGRDRFERHLGLEMRAQPEKPADAALPDMPEEDHRTWWRTAHAAWARIVADGVPMLRVALDYELRFPTWEAHAALEDPVDRALSDGRPAGPWGLVDLQRRLMAPYIAGAGAHRVEARWPDGATGDAIVGRPIEVREVRVWDSVLSPVYVQLLEGLRRITEGQRGGSFCKECGQPFLTLDARRWAFCTEKERYRYGQRQRRQRLKTITITAGSPDDELQEALVDEHDREHPPGGERDIDR